MKRNQNDGANDYHNRATLLRQIDIPTHTFNITVYQGSSDWLQQQNKGEIYSSNPETSSPLTQSIQVMNG